MFAPAQFNAWSKHFDFAQCIAPTMAFPVGNLICFLKA